MTCGIPKDTGLANVMTLHSNFYNFQSREKYIYISGCQAAVLPQSNVQIRRKYGIHVQGLEETIKGQGLDSKKGSCPELCFFFAAPTRRGNKTHVTLVDFASAESKTERQRKNLGPCFSDCLCCFPWQHIQTRCWNVRFQNDSLIVYRSDLDQGWQFI